jgi:hypothetical protein
VIFRIGSGTGIETRIGFSIPIMSGTGMRTRIKLRTTQVDFPWEKWLKFTRFL